VHVLWDLGAPAFSSAFTTVAYWRDREGEEKGSPTNRFPVIVGGKKGYVDPDAAVLVALKKFYRPIFIEVERTHKNRERLVRRFKAYEALLTDQEQSVLGVFEKSFDITPEPGLVLFLAANERHRDQLWELAAETVRPYSASHALEFWFLALTDLFDRRIEGKIGIVETQDVEAILPPAEFFRRKHAVRHGTAQEIAAYRNARTPAERDRCRRWGQIIQVSP
jgi:hypothetical protein